MILSPLLLIAAFAQAGAETAPTPFLAWKNCVAVYSRIYAPAPDGADVVARGATAMCGDLETKYALDLTRTIASVPGLADPAKEAGRLLGEKRRDLIDYGIAVVLAIRAQK